MRVTSSGFDMRGARATQPRKPGGAGTLILLMGALTLILSACNVGGVASSGNTPLAANQIFTWPYVDANGTMGHNAVLDPSQITTYKDLALVSMIYTNLVTFSPTLGIQPDAAKRWDLDKTATIYTFYLRPGMKFSDGSPITAADFAYSLDRALDSHLCADSANTYASKNAATNTYSCAQMGGAHLNYIQGWSDRLSGATSTMISNGDNPKFGLNVIDALTLRIRLTQPVPFFLDGLTYPTGDVVEKSLVENPKYPGGLWVDHLDQGGSSGPWQIKSYGSGSVMTFVPNPYWEQAFGQKLKLKQVVRPVISSVDAEYSAYRAGQYDYTDVSLGDYQFARGQSDFHTITSLETDYFGLNFKQPPLDNLKVRQALNLALNKQLIVDGATNGGAVPTNHIVPQGMPGFYPGLLTPAPDRTQSLTGNQGVALSLLNQARATCPAQNTFGEPDYCPYIFGNSPQEIDLYVPSEDKTNVTIAQNTASAWNQALGLNVKVKAVTFDALVQNLGQPAASDPMQIWQIGWIADYPDPEDWLTLQFTPNGGFDSEGIDIASLTTLLNNADIEQNPTKRMQMYNQAEQTVVDQGAWIPFQQAKLAWRLRPYVRGFGYDGLGLMLDINWPNVYIAAQ